MAGEPSAEADTAPVLSEDQARAEAERAGTEIEVTARRGESSELFAKPDGTFELVEHVSPVRTLRNGRWVAIDATLHRAADGSVAPAATPLDVAFSGGGDQPLIRLRESGRDLRLSWPQPLPEPILDRDTATYPSVLPDVDLRLTADVSGVSQIFVVKTREAAHNPALRQLTLQLASNGLKVRENAQGGLEAVDSGAGGVVFRAPLPVMWDSPAAPASDEPARHAAAGPAGARSAPLPDAAETAGGPVPSGIEQATHTAPIQVDVADEQDALLLTPDRALLDDPDTRYPVYIDPTWDSPKATDWVGVSRAYPNQPYWHFSNKSDFGMGFCGADPACAPSDVKRVLYQVPTTKFAGKHILSAEFVAHETHSYSCTARSVELWQTKAISSGTDWTAQKASGFWTTKLATSSFAHGWGSSCPAADVEWGGTSGAVKDAVQKAANSSARTMTFGLRATDETDNYAWKRWSNSAYLRVQYNLPPKQARMARDGSTLDLTMSPGVCQTSPALLNRIPSLTAKLSDPDGDKVGAQFAAGWDIGDGQGHKRRWWSTGAEGTAPASSTFKASGSTFSVTLPTSIPQNKSIGWEVRAWDGAEWGSWSSAGDPQTNCYFNYDTTRPPGPTVTSADYPGSMDPTADLPWIDGVGRYGTFSIRSTASDVTMYQWGLDASASSAHQLTTSGGAAKTVTLLPQTEGVHFLSVTAIDSHGNASQPETYYFAVRRGQPERGSWDLDEAAGATAVTGSGGSYPAALGGGAVLGEPGQQGTAAGLNGSDAYLESSGAVLDTTRSYTVAGWVRLDRTGRNYTALAQDGTYHAGFYLGYGRQ
ncbi:hypothetical protein ACIQGZ_11200 [Streptomyces sp. NPDC092296]|uniref:hypothetical protein n=1 Tax=Streptomyces sp. NPDC092296 TaxID=3366012 RepID=UPI003814B769